MHVVIYRVQGRLLKALANQLHAVQLLLLEKVHRVNQLNLGPEVLVLLVCRCCFVGQVDELQEEGSLLKLQQNLGKKDSQLEVLLSGEGLLLVEVIDLLGGRWLDAVQVVEGREEGLKDCLILVGSLGEKELKDGGVEIVLN